MKPGVLYKDSFLGVKLHTFVNPAFARVGVRGWRSSPGDPQPPGHLQLRRLLHHVRPAHVLPKPGRGLLDTELQRRGDANENYPGYGHLVTLAALLQAKVKNVAVRDNLKFYYADLALRGGDTVFYDQTLDISQPDEAWTLTNDARSHLPVRLRAQARRPLHADPRLLSEEALPPRRTGGRSPTARPTGLAPPRFSPSMTSRSGASTSRRSSFSCSGGLVTAGAPVRTCIPPCRTSCSAFCSRATSSPIPASGRKNERGLETLQHTARRTSPSRPSTTCAASPPARVSARASTSAAWSAGRRTFR